MLIPAFLLPISLCLWRKPSFLRTLNAGLKGDREPLFMNRDAVCRNITDEIKRLKEKEKMLSFLPPEVRLLYGTTPGGPARARR